MHALNISSRENCANEDDFELFLFSPLDVNGSNIVHCEEAHALNIWTYKWNSNKIVFIQHDFNFWKEEITRILCILQNPLVFNPLSSVRT